MSVSLSEPGYMHSEEAGGGGYQYQVNNYSSVSEIEEEGPSEVVEIEHGGGVPMAPIREEFEGSSLFSFDVQNWEDCVFVAVGKSESSMEAVAWALKHAITTPSTMVYLIHVFPEVQYIPSPLGRLPKSQVGPAQVESFMAQERGKRRELLQKFLDACFNSGVKVDTMLIESDMIAKAILDLIPILNMRKLVIGTTKSNLRKLRSRKGSGIADQILQDALVGCEVKIICEGKEVIDPMNESPSPHGNDDNSKPMQDQQDQRDNSFSCMCFKPKVM